jgi:hypothetical protein
VAPPLTNWVRRDTEARSNRDRISRDEFNAQRNEYNQGLANDLSKRAPITGVLPPMPVNPNLTDEQIAAREKYLGITPNVTAGKARLDAVKMAADIAAKKKAEKERQAKMKQDAAFRLSETKRVSQELIQNEKDTLKENLRLSQEIERIGKEGFELERLKVKQDEELRLKTQEIEDRAKAKSASVRGMKGQGANDAIKMDLARQEFAARTAKQNLLGILGMKEEQDIARRQFIEGLSRTTENDQYGQYKDKYGNTKFGDRPQDAEMTDTAQQALIKNEDYKRALLKYTADWEAALRNKQRDEEFKEFQKSELQKQDMAQKFAFETNQVKGFEYVRYLDAQIAAEKQNTERYRELYTERYGVLKDIIEKSFGKRQGKNSAESFAEGFDRGGNIIKHTLRDVAAESMAIMGATFKKGFGGFFGDIFAKTLSSLISNALEDAIEAMFRKKKKKESKGGGIFGIFGSVIGAVLDPIGAIMGAVGGGSKGGGGGGSSDASSSGLQSVTRMAELSARAFQSQGASVRFAGAAAAGNSNSVNINLGGVNVNSRADADYLADRLMVEAERKLRVRY